MEKRVPKGHVKDLTYLEPRRLAFENTSASTKRVVLMVTPDPRDEIIRQPKEEIAKLSHEHSTPAERVSSLELHQPKVLRPEVSHIPYYSKIVTYDEEQQEQSYIEQQNPRRKVFLLALLLLGIS
ncbi:hypothetical protein RJT34_05697 [Clitoria ternatea]|uniref:Uncharacterized protein n=1 Tax=Clitoria ternatea TaxID=43366 RepID=A0AAN9K2J1_CLITE